MNIPKAAARNEVFHMLTEQKSTKSLISLCFIKVFLHQKILCQKVPDNKYQVAG